MYEAECSDAVIAAPGYQISPICIREAA